VALDTDAHLTCSGMARRIVEELNIGAPASSS